ncbi:MAG TPA: alpha/beta hydrolase [Gemmatimonadales bacterium]|jgi:alpha-beta hydrolase superfamily lysophospholipase
MADWSGVESLTAPDGARLALRRQSPRGAARGTVIFVHGWGDYTGRWAWQVSWLADRGLAVYGCDQRGHGDTSGSRGHVDRFTQFLSDLGALRKLASAESPGPQLLLGHSFGGFIVLRYLETSPAGVAGAALLTPFLDLYVPPPQWKIKMAKLIVDLLPRLPIPTGLEYEAISRDPLVVNEFRDDPRCHEVMTPRAYTEAMATQALLREEAAKIHTPLFVALAGADRIVSTPAAERFTHLLAGDVSVRSYEGMYHNILHEPDRDRVLDDLGPWLDKTLAGRAAA